MFRDLADSTEFHSGSIGHSFDVLFAKGKSFSMSFVLIRDLADGAAIWVGNIGLYIGHPCCQPGQYSISFGIESPWGP